MKSPLYRKIPIRLMQTGSLRCLTRPPASLRLISSFHNAKVATSTDCGPASATMISPFCLTGSGHLHYTLIPKIVTMRWACLSSSTSPVNIRNHFLYINVIVRVAKRPPVICRNGFRSRSWSIHETCFFKQRTIQVPIK